MALTLSKTQVDRVGDRLREGAYAESDVRLLDEYRRSFDDAYQTVVRTLRQGGFDPTGRPSKSTASIVEKLHRESIRLSQMQDIAGCRIVVPTVLEQEQSVSSLRAAFPGATVVDRCQIPSHGYRAVHIIPEPLGKPIEIQVRSSLQHLWSELSEKLSDRRDPAIKYGGGPHVWQVFLTTTSDLVGKSEKIDRKPADPRLARSIPDDLKSKLEEMEELHKGLAGLFAGLSSHLDKNADTLDWSVIEPKLLSALTSRAAQNR